MGALLPSAHDLDSALGWRQRAATLWALPEVLAQSYLSVRGSQLEAGGDIGVVTAGYAWEGSAPWE